MKHPKFRKELFLAIIFSAIYLSLRIFHYHFDRFFQGISIDIITYIVLGILVILLVVQIQKIIKRRKKSKGRIKLRFVYYIPAIILLLSILYTFTPYQFDSEKLEGKIILKACFEGGNSQATLRFRSDNSFEMKWIQENGYDEWYFGVFKMVKDTIFMTYTERFPEKFGSVVLNTGQALKCIDRPHTENGYYVPFYIGDCKGTPR